MKELTKRAVEVFKRIREVKDCINMKSSDIREYRIDEHKIDEHKIVVFNIDKQAITTKTMTKNEEWEFSTIYVNGVDGVTTANTEQLFEDIDVVNEAIDSLYININKALANKVVKMSKLITTKV